MTNPSEPTSARAEPARSRGSDRPAVADLVLAAGVLLLFVTALLETFEWSFRTALFPRIVTVAGALFALVLLVTSGWARYSRRRDRGAVAQLAPDELLDEEDVHDQAVEYVYATAGKAAWAQALAWVALFVVLLWVTGLFVTAGVFAFTYLRWGASRSWLFAAVYAAVMAAVLYVALSQLLVVPVPEGVFG